MWFGLGVAALFAALFGLVAVGCRWDRASIAWAVGGGLLLGAMCGFAVVPPG